ncbi:MAG: glutamine synthetase beta-grasp domain-containing protein, partial [Alphaproteobacteria bacterium]|nr:glutamine synthetase beta-grasp domain-containing protein [Alphaproteobacteria bacterium]
MSDVSTVMKMIEENNVRYVDLRFTDPRGKWQHTAQHVSTISEDTFTDGIMFDGSSIAGWKSIHESDMTLMPDPTTAVLDPFAAQDSLILFCDVYEPTTGEAYARDPRSTAKRAEAYLASTGIGDTAFFGPELEFFVFDDVRFEVTQKRSMFEIDSEEGPYNSAKPYEEGNMGHRPGPKGGYFPVPPVDGGMDMRAEMVSVLHEMGVHGEKHHHEVAPSQHELGFRLSQLTDVCDIVQKYKYVVHMVAAQYGKTATFMPKPVWNDNGTGMHVHQSIWKGGEPI